MTEQKPLGSGFGPHTMAEEVLAGRNLQGKIAIVTGGDHCAWSVVAPRLESTVAALAFNRSAQGGFDQHACTPNIRDRAL